MCSFLSLVNAVLGIYWWVILGSVVMSWLVAFNVVNLRNRFVYTIWDVLNRLTEPLLRPIRRILPNLGGIDVSPVALILLLSFVRSLLVNELAASVGCYVRF